MEDVESFTKLFARVRAGEQDAMTKLHDDYGEQIQRIVGLKMARFGMRHQLESLDICQSVWNTFFVRTALGAVELETPAKLVALLAEMAKNRCLHHKRKANTAKRYGQMVNIDDVDAVGPDQTPSQIAIAREMCEKAASLLSNEERQLVEQRKEGRTWEEVAANQQANGDTLRMHHRRVVERIEKELDLKS
ncbi:MAG: RNA polymerase sigma factor [Pirellulaceae bacterium]